MTTTTTVEQIAELMPDATQLLSDEPEMESTLHWAQLVLLATCLEWRWRECDDFFIGTNLTIYFSRQQLKTRDFRGPDFFLVKGTNHEPRTSWVVWEEGGKYPDLIIELLSESTAEVDRTTKRQLYQDRFRTPEYFWFDPHSLELVGLRLVGSQYQEIPLQQPGMWSEILELYLGIVDGQLRFLSEAGELMPTPQESAVRSAEAALMAQREVERLKAKLRALEVDPEIEE